MNGSETKKRNISAHNLPMNVIAPRPRGDSARATGPASAFLAQVLATRDSTPVMRARRPNTIATTTYRSVEASDVKRMPMGYRKTLSA